MAARYPIRLAPLPLSAHAPQSNANANSLAGGSACSYGLLVLKGQNVPNIVCAGSHVPLAEISQVRFPRKN